MKAVVMDSSLMCTSVSAELDQDGCFRAGRSLYRPSGTYSVYGRDITVGEQVGTSDWWTTNLPYPFSCRLLQGSQLLFVPAECCEDLLLQEFVDIYLELLRSVCKNNVACVHKNKMNFSKIQTLLDDLHESEEDVEAEVEEDSDSDSDHSPVDSEDHSEYEEEVEEEEDEKIM